MQKTHDSKGRARRPTQGAAGPKHLPDKEDAIKAGEFDEVCPSHLNEHGRELWLWAVARLKTLGILDKADAKHLELLAETYEDYRMGQEDVAKLGHIIAQETEGGTIYRRNPACVTVEKCRLALRSFYSDFGLTPSARAKFGAPESESDPLEELFRAARN